MERQRSKSHTEEHNRAPEKALNKMEETRHLTDAGLTTGLQGRSANLGEEQINSTGTLLRR